MNNKLNQLITKLKSNNTKLVLIWSRYDNYNYQYDYDFDLESLDVNATKNNNNNDREITITILESDKVNGKPFFSGRNLENIISILQYDQLALSIWISRDLYKIVISKKKKEKEKELNIKA